MAVKRLFFGAFIDNSLFDGIYDDLKEAFEPTFQGKWTEQNNLHFTYKFLGNVEEDRIDELVRYTKRSLTDINSVIKIAGLGRIPLTTNPQLIFARISNRDKSVMYHFNNIEKSMIKLGFAPEKRKFLPHITLLRIKKINGEYNELMDKYKDLQFGFMKSYRVNLIESTLTQDGPIYNIIA
ncbi:MAG TPA: RNA 2',3'-cyclic phosphodiesterase [Candidatus Kapabacteria bacterium]|nr:RNA 2',3'-cyclic phosphodiesterase [Candidatus Kapabacteria bacterium]